MAVKWRIPDSTGRVFISPEFGDDRNDGSSSFPAASTGGGESKGTSYVLNGVFYNEQLTTNGFYQGDGFCKFINNTGTDFSMNAGGGANGRDIYWQGYTSYNGNAAWSFSVFEGIKQQQRNTFDNIHIYALSTTGTASSWGNNNNAPQRSTLIFQSEVFWYSVSSIFEIRNSIIACIGQGKILYSNNSGSGTQLALKNTKYSAFVNCPIKMVNGSGTDETDFEIPNSITELRQRAVAVYGGVEEDYFPNCIVVNGDVLNEDYSPKDNALGLQLATASEDFSFVGARNISLQWKATDYVLGANTQLVNNDSIELISETSNGSATSVIKSAGRVREIQRQNLVAIEQHLLGQQIDSTQTLSDTQISPVFNSPNYEFTGLTIGEFYVVEGDTADYDHDGTGVKTYLVGESIPITATGGTTVIGASADSRLRQVLEAPNKANIEWRWSKGGEYTEDISTRSIDDWLRVAEIDGDPNSGAQITYDGNTYGINEYIKKTAANTITGATTYKLEFVFNDSEPYKQIERSLSESLSIDAGGLGNGDPNFDYGTEVNILGKFFQNRITLNVKNNPYHV